MTYIYQRPDWPHFNFNWSAIAEALAVVRHKQGLITGHMRMIGLAFWEEAILNTLTEDVVTSSQIEGEHLSRPSVRSSVARQLGFGTGLPAAERGVDGVVEMMVDATRNYDQPLTNDRLFGWHAALFPAGRSGMRAIDIGRWRSDSSGPMQVVSGRPGKEHIHFQAPEAKKLDAEMLKFLTWFNGEHSADWVVRAALAHLWFVTIHPFDDGNGRIARAIADLALARSGNSANRFYSMSAQIQRERQQYYDHLEAAQRGELDVTAWIVWFLTCLTRSLDRSHAALTEVFRRDRFWRENSKISMTTRQRNVLVKLLDGFEGKLTTTKWAKLGKCSQDSAARDIATLERAGILKRNSEGGRSTSYSLIVPLLPAI